MGTLTRLLGDAVLCPEKDEEERGTGLVSPSLVGCAWTSGTGWAHAGDPGYCFPSTQGGGIEVFLHA